MSLHHCISSNPYVTTTDEHEFGRPATALVADPAR
jgi:hypothetical protein